MKYDPIFFWDEDFVPLENEFLKYSRFVPLVEAHYDVWSLELANQLLKIGSSIESSLKGLATFYFDDLFEKYNENCECPISFSYLHGSPICEKYRKFSRNPNMGILREIIEPKFILSNKNVYVLKNKLILKPFLEWSNNKSPEWWIVFTKLKHDKHKYKELATLKITLNALAALFLLNLIHKESILHLSTIGVVKPRQNNFFRYYNAETAKNNLFGYIFPQSTILCREDPWEKLSEH